MATIIRRNDGRFEIRESVSTPKGPRSRTLATFNELSVEVLSAARLKAKGRFDARALRERAEELEVPWVGPTGAGEARSVIARLKAGDVPPAFMAALREATAKTDATLPDTIPPMLDWVGADDEERGRALRDLIRLGDQLSRSTGNVRGALLYPPLKGIRRD